MKRSNILYVVFVAVAVLAAIFFWFNAQTIHATDFKSCVEEGNPVMESYPRQCKSSDGRTFIKELDEPLIGGQKDEHGCLGPAGYSWAEDVGACTRSWEIIGDDAIRAAKIAVEYAGSGYGLTVTQINALNCQGCFNVELTDSEQGKTVLDLIGWNITLEGECGDCPQFSPPAPGWCEGGTVVAGQTDECGCQTPPKCVMEELEKRYCTQAQRGPRACTLEYYPVCGWFNNTIKCFKHPCAMTYVNGCSACADEKVEYWTKGECPQ